MKMLLRTLAAAAASLPLVAVSAGANIVIGQSAPLTGSNAEIGKDIRDGAAALLQEGERGGSASTAGRSSSSRSTTRTTARPRAPTP
jgi:ABC-type branched-subunit amino acid transport system substrate-binding protein